MSELASPVGSDGHLVGTSNRVGKRPTGRDGSVAAALLLALLVLAPTLGLRGIWAPDETRYAEVAREMLESGPWSVPRLFGEFYVEKGPVFFWILAGLARLGVPLSAAPRLASVAASLGMLCLLPVIGAKLGGSPSAVGRSALILATTPLFLVYGQMGLVDPWLAFLVSVAVAAKVCRSGSSPPRRIALAALEGSALGAALLSKGIVVALFPLGLRLGALVVRRRRTPADFDASDLGVLTLALLLVLAWVAVAWDVAGEPYVHAITLGQLERRLGVHAPHSRPFGFLPLVTLLGLLPWSLFGLNGLWRRERRLAIWTWDTSAPLLGWFVVPALLLSLLPAQQPHYLLPAVPAAALLVAPTASAPADPWLRRLLAGLALVLGGGLIAAALAPHELLRLGKGGALGLQGVLGDPAVRLAAGSAGGVLLALLGWPRRWGRAHRFWLRAATGSVVFFGCAVVVVSRADPFLMPRSLLESPALASAGRLAAVGGLRSAVCLATGRRDVGGVDEQALRRGLRGDPSLVALVWRKSLRDLPGDAGQSSGLEEIGQGWFRGRPLVAVRSRVAGEASSTPP